MDISLIIIFIAVFCLSFYFIRRQKNLPPGPFRLPVLGSIFFLNELRKFRPHELLAQTAKKYGDVMSFGVGPQLVVALNGYDVIHEALVNQADVFSGRPLQVKIIQRAFIEDGKKGRGVVLNDYGPTWRHMRRFTLQVLRDFGVGKTSLEDKVLTEIEAVSKRLETLEGKPVIMNTFLQNVISNVINAIIFGRRYDYDEPEFKKVIKITREAVSGDGAFSLGNFLPEMLVKIINRKVAERESNRVQAFRDMRQYVMEQIDEHDATFDKDNIRDFIDVYLKTVQDDSSKDEIVIEKEEMFRVIMDLFLAGAETTSTTLDWAMLYMSEYPEVQKKCQEEITEVFGERTMLYADRKMLTYCEATLLEIQRISTILPNNVFHNTLRDTTLRGYNIPKGTMIIPSIYSTSFDPKYWNQPSEFRPERFINSAGKLIKNEAMIPFSTGPRQCLGEPLARMELFLVFVNLLQRFTFEPADKTVKHSFDSVMFQVTNSPTPYKTRVFKRK